MKNNKIKKKIGALALSGFILMGLAMPAFATSVPREGILKNGTEGKDVKLQITKEFQFNEGIATPDAEFDFKISGITEDAPKAKITRAVFAKNEPTKINNGKQSVVKNVNVSFDKFPHAGVYGYEVNENKGKIKGVTYDESKYKLAVHVANNKAMDGGTYIKAIVAEKNGSKAPIKFLNTYTKNHNLIIEKKITGEMANLDKKFKFDLTIGNGHSVQRTYNGKIRDKDGSELSTVVFKAGTMQSVELGHGEQLKFDEIEVGTRYTVKETGAKDGYTPYVTVVENGTTVTNKEMAAGEEQGIEVSNKLVGENENRVTFINEYNPITITGIIENNLPFIIMIGIAIVGLGVLVAIKKRKMVN